MFTSIVEQPLFKANTQDNYISQDTRDKLAEEGKALPDGSYPIRNRQDLRNAIQAFGRAKNKQRTKKFIIKRAKELNAESMLPENWLEKAAIYSDFLSNLKAKRISKYSALLKSYAPDFITNNTSDIINEINARREQAKDILNNLYYCKEQLLQTKSEISKELRLFAELESKHLDTILSIKTSVPNESLFATFRSNFMKRKEELELKYNLLDKQRDFKDALTPILEDMHARDEFGSYAIGGLTYSLSDLIKLYSAKYNID